MVRSVTEHESPWTQQSLDAALDYLAYEDSLCGCGKPFTETTGKANTFRYVAEIRRCHACKAREMVEQQLRKEGSSPGTKIVVREAEGWTPY